MSSRGKLIGSGRAADVYEIDEAWVLRRNREDWGDAAAECAVMEHVRAHGYPVPAVRPGDSRTDLVMERLTGPTMLEALTAGTIGPHEAGTELAALLRQLHAIPGRRPGTRVLHLDLHPENVMLTPAGPRVIDWGTAEDGDPGLDWGLSAVILAQIAVDDLPIAAPARTSRCGGGVGSIAGVCAWAWCSVRRGEPRVGVNASPRTRVMGQGAGRCPRLGSEGCGAV